MKTFSLFILSLLISIGYLSGADWNVQIARYKQDKACAISYTFETGVADKNILRTIRVIEKGLKFEAECNWKREVSGEHSGYVVPI